MKEIEGRVTALELAFIEVGTWLDPAALKIADAARCLRFRRPHRHDIGIVAE